MMARLMVRRLLLPASLAVLAACKGSATPSGPILPSADFADSGVPFDKDEVVPSAAFSDFNALAAADIQSFLERDPYGGVSFLQTYQSNGVLFSAAVAHAAGTYRINPIVLLVAVEAIGGLIGDVGYPQPFASVDYLFGCGCSVAASPATCDPAAAGLDVQLDCYANALRTSLDAIAANGATSGGFGPGKSSTTADGVNVTPKDDSTAALYQYDPVVGSGQSGSSLFANIWLEYTTAFSYGIPMEANPGAIAQVGDPCIDASDCAVDDAICATMNYPGGLCTAKCSGTCSGADTFCAAFSTGGFCLSLCSPTDPWSCRTGYACTLVQPSGAPAGTPSQYVCDVK
jgi:hypothetical protein